MTVETPQGPEGDEQKNNLQERYPFQQGHDLLDGIVTKLSQRLTENLTEEEIRFNRTRVGRMLPTKDRIAYEESFTALDLAERDQQDIAHENEAEIVNIDLDIAEYQRMIEVSAGEPALIPVYERMITKLQRTREHLIEQGRRVPEVLARVMTVAREMTMKVATEMLKTKIDANTGFQTRTAMLEQLYDDVFVMGVAQLKELGSPEGGIPPGMSEWEKVLIGAGDMSGFRIGNDTEGHAQFDILLREDLARKFIATSRFLGTETDAYGQLQVDDFESYEALEEVFPPESEYYQLLLKAKKEGARIIPQKFRDKGGGDETGYLIRFPDGFTPERQELALAIQKRIYETVLLSKHKDALLRPLQERAENFPNQLEVTLGEFPHAERLNYNETELDILNAFSDLLRQYNIHAGVGTEIVENQDLRIAMGATVAWTRGDQAFVAFMMGMDLEGNVRLDAEGKPIGLIDPRTRQINEQAMQNYQEQLYLRLENIVKAVGISNPELARDFISKAISNDIFNNAIELLFHKVEEDLKPEEKKELVVEAFKGSAVKLYEVASLAHGGRLGRSELSPSLRVDIVRQLRDHYIPLFAAQLALPLEQRDQNLMLFYYGLRNKMEQLAEHKPEIMTVLSLPQDPYEAEIQTRGGYKTVFKPTFELPQRDRDMRKPAKADDDLSKEG